MPRKLLVLPGLFIFAGLVFGYLLYSGRIWFVYPSEAIFKIRGIDISHHQGKIDWRRVSQVDLQFVYIKATEGSDFKDPMFEENWQAAARARIGRGAYHFFTPCRSGEDQAANFIRSVPLDAQSLPPVLDAEFIKNCADAARAIDVQREISRFILRLQKHFGKPVTIYTTYDFMKLFPLAEFATNPIWIRSIYAAPAGEPSKDWLIWQYKNRGQVAGIKGYVDMNVFSGDENRFIRYSAGLR